MTRLMRALAMVSLQLVPHPVVAATIVLNNGMLNVVAGVEFFDDTLYVQNMGCDATLEDPCVSPGAPTALELIDLGTVASLRVFESSSVSLDGGEVNGSLRALDSSSVMFVGGSVEALSAFDSSTVVMNGGEIFGGSLSAQGTADVTVNEGSMAALRAWEGSTVRMTGGTVLQEVGARDSSTVTVSGGTMRDLLANDLANMTFAGGGATVIEASGSSSVAVTGGGVSGSIETTELSSVSLRGGLVVGLLVADDSSTIAVVGTGFELDDIPVGFGPLPEPVGTLTGTLESGDPLTIDICHNGCPFGSNGPATGLITLVPEPGHSLLFAFAVGGIAAMKLRRVRRTEDATFIADSPKVRCRILSWRRRPAVVHSA